LSLTLSAKANCISAPAVWNSLSDDLVTSRTELVGTFGNGPKTELFYVAKAALTAETKQRKTIPKQRFVSDALTRETKH